MWSCLRQSCHVKNRFLVVWNKQISAKYSILRCQAPVWQNSRITRSSALKDLFINGKNVRHASSGTSSVKNIRGELKRLLLLAKPERWRLSGAILLLLVSSSVTMAVPFCVGKLIDILSSSKEDMKSSLIDYCHVLVLIFAVGALANLGRVYLMNTSSYRIVNSLRKRAYRSILSQEVGFFDCTSTGELINRLSSDTTAVGTSITNNVSDGMRSAFSFIASSSLMVYTSPSLAMLGLMTVTPVAVIAVVSAKFLKRNSQQVQSALAGATQVAEERLSNIRTVHAFARLNEEYDLFQSKINSIMQFATKEALGRAVFFGMTGFSGNLIILSVLYYGGIMMNESQLTIGSLSSFLLYAAYAGISINGLSTFYSELMRGLGASTRLWELIDRTPLIAIHGGTELPNLTGSIKFTEVNFAYPTRLDAPVLTDFSLSIPAHSVYAIVGSSGCGKSTVGSLLLRFYDCQSGCITIDDKDIKSLDLCWLRRCIGIVSQDPALFSFSIRENILYGALEGRNVDDNMLEDILQKANALEFVKQFPNGLDTIVGERGVMLSGGQRQRIAIARALLKNPKILILDEATSALDAESEYFVQVALEQLMKDRTVITIAHRLSTVKKADVIVVLGNGRIVEEGSYEDLISRRGPFYHLVQHQSLKS